MSLSDEERDIILDAIKTAHGNNETTVLILDNPTESSINLALMVRQALTDLLGHGSNIIVHPASSTMFIRIEEGENVRTFNVSSLRKFDDLVKREHEPLEQANPSYSNPFYLFGVAIEKVLMDNFLVFNGKAKQ